MLRKIIATLTALAAGVLVVGVAWASGNADTSTSATVAGSSSVTVDSTGSSPEDSTVVSLDDDRATSTSLDADGITSTSFDDSSGASIDDDGTTSTSLDDDDDTTATTVQSPTSSSSGSSTSTSTDDSNARPADGLSTHDLPGVGSVAIEVRAGVLVLVDVSAPGWHVELEKVEEDRIEIGFRLGEAEAKFEARIEHARVEVEIELDSD